MRRDFHFNEADVTLNFKVPTVIILKSSTTGIKTKLICRRCQQQRHEDLRLRAS